MEIDINHYNDVIVRVSPEPEKDEKARFMVRLNGMIETFRAEGRSAVWLHLPCSRSALIPDVLTLKFVPHHCSPEYFMFALWLLDPPSKLPHFGTHIARIEAIIIREKSHRPSSCGQILLVKEREFEGGGGRRNEQWKLLSGNIDQGEYVEDAAVREVAEETGLNVKFVSVLGYGNRTSAKFGRNEIFFICHMRLVDESQLNELSIQREELKDARWFDVSQVLNSGDEPCLLKGLQKRCLISAMNRKGMTKFISSEDSNLSSGPHRLHAHFVSNAPSSSSFAFGRRRQCMMPLTGRDIPQ